MDLHFFDIDLFGDPNYELVYGRRNQDIIPVAWSAYDAENPIESNKIVIRLEGERFFRYFNSIGSREGQCGPPDSSLFFRRKIKKN